jgi:UDP-N-acetylmuramate--alanine ligase
LLKPTVAVVTNVDDEHMNAYRSRKDLEDSFRRFVGSVPFYGLAVLCVDDPIVREIAQECKRRVVTYGFSEGAELRAVDVVASKAGMEFTVLAKNEDLGRFVLPMLGRHLVQNSLAAIAVGREFGIPADTIRSALSSFGGVKRRLEIIGEARGVTIMNDYGHHPTEIRATLRAIRECFGGDLRRFHVIFQPHRYSRTKMCWNEFLDAFKDCDCLYVSDIYAASEEPLEGVNGEALCSAINHTGKCFVPHIDDAPSLVAGAVTSGDLVLCLGAGSVGMLPERILAAISCPLPAANAEPESEGAFVSAAVG